MQVTELSADGLKREYRVVVPADDIEGRVQGRLTEIGQKVRMPGFRPGKVPVKLLRKQYGKSVMGEVLEEAVNQGSQKAISDNELRPALRPDIEITSFDEGKDLEFKMALEVLPEVPGVDYSKIELTRLKAEIPEQAVDDALNRLAEGRREYAPIEEPRPAAEGDRVTVDFVGRTGGEAFEGGSAEGARLVLGSGRMIPGFEDNLKGAEVDKETVFTVTFPETYPNAELAGKEAEFTATVRAIEAPKDLVIDDEFAKQAGIEEGLGKLRDMLREQLANEYARVSRLRLKRQLLDRLAERYHFEVPKGMVDLEFEAIWKQLEQEMERTKTTFDDGGKSEAELREEYRGLAERRVRLGLLLSEVGRQNNLKVEENELRGAVVEQARRYPGQEREVFEFYQKNPQALEQLRAPIFEDKAVDFIFQLAKVEETTVAPEELMRDPDAEEDEAVENAGKA